jgi:hypothetical protein
MAVLIPSMAHSLLHDDPKHWRQLAQDARAAARLLDDPEERKTLLEIADGYEQLASIAETRADSRPSR